MLIERTHTNHCAFCQTEVLNLCWMERVFCSEFCHWHMYNYAEDPDDPQDEEDYDVEEEDNSIPFTEWKEMIKTKYVSKTNACC